MSYFANSSNIEVEVLDGTARLEKEWRRHHGPQSPSRSGCRTYRLIGHVYRESAVSQTWTRSRRGH